MNDAEMSSKDAVRRRAEEIAAQIPVDPAALSPEAERLLLHELQVHQIELEIQNEELRRTQIELEASRARYFDLYDLAPVGYVTISEKGIIQEANLTLADLLGLTRKEVVQRPLTHFILPADQDIFYLHHRKLFATDAPQICELRLLRANGDPFWGEIEAIRVGDDEGGQTGRIVISDISARKQSEKLLQQSHHRLEEAIAELRHAQAQLVQQERLAAVGQLAAGIAHDFNNILAVITLYIEMSLRLTDLSPQLQKRLEIMGHQTGRAAHLVEQILDFGRRAVLKSRSMDLLLFLQEQVEIWRRTIPESIKIYLQEAADSECFIHADPIRLQQMFTNLVLNARDAMPHGGELHLTLRQFRLEHAEPAPLPDMIAGSWVGIAISDTGNGIPAATQPHIFEPFFSARGPGRGSGLGLAQVYGIVKQHEGHIDVQSEVGRGTTFTIYLPTLSAVEPRAAVTTPAAPLKGNGETILVVEDNKFLREALASTLDMLNYRVLTAADGREALSILERQVDDSEAGAEAGGDASSDPAIALVLSDMVMPEMDGKALFQALRQRGLTIPVVILSGHPMEAQLQVLQAQGLAGWLLKPIGTNELAAIVARLVSKKLAALAPPTGEAKIEST